MLLTVMVNHGVLKLFKIKEPSLLVVMTTLFTNIVLKRKKWLNKERFGHMIWWEESHMKLKRLNQLLLLLVTILFNNKQDVLPTVHSIIMLQSVTTTVMLIFLIITISVRELPLFTSQGNGVKLLCTLQMETMLLLDLMMIPFTFIKYLKQESILYIGV